MNQKILNTSSLKKFFISKNLKRKKIVLCHGAFDLVHLGHLRHFESAKSLGDILIVSVTSDKFIYKGPGRPKFNQIQRMEFLSRLNMIDYVILSNDISAVSIIKAVKPKIYCKGPDYKNLKDDITGNIYKEKTAVESFGGKIAYTDDETFSSSNLLNNSSTENNHTIKHLKKMININKTLDDLEKIKDSKVLVIGETIIDEYVFCEAIGKSGKEPVLVMHDKYCERYLGGIGAVANHIGSFCKNVSLLSFLGDKDDEKKFIKKSLQKHIKTIFLKKEKSPTIVKRRYLDEVNQNKVLGVYKINDSNLSKKNEDQFLSKLKKIINNFDVVVLTDYGHGMITSKIAKFLCKESKYLAINSQINASNIGYQNLHKYNNFDFLILNEGEIRHDARDRVTSKEKLAKKLISKLRVKKAIVTSGKDGAIMVSNNSKNKDITCPAYAGEIVDKIGAGDAMLSIASLTDSARIDDASTLLLSSLAAAQTVEVVGNKEYVSNLKLKKAFYYLLK